MSAHTLVRGGFWRDQFYYPSINLSAVPLEFGQFLKLPCWSDRAPSKKKVGRLAVFPAVSPYRSEQILDGMSTGQQSGSRGGLREALYVVCESHHECNIAVLQSCLGELWEECVACPFCLFCYFV